MAKKESVKNQKAKPSDEELCKIVSQSVAQIMRFSLDEDFREKILKVLKVSSTKQAEDEIRLKLASVISDGTKNQNEALLLENSIMPPSFLDSSSSSKLTECSNLQEVSVRHEVINKNLGKKTSCKDTEHIQMCSDSNVSTESVQATLINLMNSDCRSSEVYTAKVASQDNNLLNEDLIIHQEERISSSQSLLSGTTRKKQKSNLQEENSQSTSISEKEDLEISNIDVGNYTQNHSEQALLTDSQQSTNSQSSSLSQEIFEKNWLEIFSTKYLKGRRLHRTSEMTSSNDFTYFLSNSQDLLGQDLSSISENILSSNQQDFFVEECFSLEDGSNFRKTIKRNEQNFLEANMKRQKTQNLKCSSLMDFCENGLSSF